ncbi:MAG: hypothetical protein L0I24_12250 [Pseudonocardia sp.]|nr:hypothetical protein [Pseudonocardia sp.]
MAAVGFVLGFLLWPSGPMAEALLARRSRAGDRHVRFPGAGHLIRLGLFPTDAPWTGGVAFGGDRAGLADAQRLATARGPGCPPPSTARCPIPAAPAGADGV